VPPPARAKKAPTPLAAATSPARSEGKKD
jgi:hypothetical protein